MNAMEWLKAVRENPQKSPVPPVPPDGVGGKTSGNTGIPPVPPCSSKHFLKNENNLLTTTSEQKEMYWGDEPEPGSSGGDRGNQGFLKGNEDLLHKGDRGNGDKAAVLETLSPSAPSLPLPFLTTDGTLSIPFGSDSKYHWWNGGQSLAQTRAEVLARIEAERAKQAVG